MKSQDFLSSPSLIILCAHPHEAAPVIEELQLRKVHGNHPVERHFHLFRSESVMVAVVGIGKLRAAAATAALLTYLPAPPKVLCNVGIAGASSSDDKEKTFFISKIEDSDSGVCYYPDIPIAHPFEERFLRCSAQPLFQDAEEIPPGRFLVDMESAGIFQAATFFLSCDQLAFVKVVSDNLERVALNKEIIRNLLTPSTPHLIALLQKWVSFQAEHTELEHTLREVVLKAAEQLKLSFTQAKQFERLCREWYAHTGEAVEQLTSLLSTLPVPSSKGERSEAFRELQRAVRARYQQDSAVQ